VESTVKQIESMRLKTLTPAVSHSESHATSVAPPPELTPFQLEMIKILDIPVHLTDRPQGTADLHIAYTKDEALLEAKVKLLHMRNNGSWMLRKPKSEELTEIFISKTVWHSKYTKLFPVAKDHPHLMKWLENTPDAPVNTGVRSFLDCIFWVNAVFDHSWGYILDEDSVQSLQDCIFW
jgi:hypothetical protein